jgi:dGTPase
MTEWGGFDHNVQTLRAVTLLENRYADHDGLNLTWETLEGVLKHNGPLVDNEGNPVGKYAKLGWPWGLDNISAVDDLELHTYSSCEGQIAAIADDIAYNAHDLDDALRAGILNVAALSDVPVIGPIVVEVTKKWPDIGASRQAHEVQRRLITRSIEDVIKTSTNNIAELAPQSAKDIRSANQAMVQFSADFRLEEAKLKQFLFENVYRSDAVMRNVTLAEAALGRLFDHLFATPDLPDDWQEIWDSASAPAQRARIICDFVAGMTDPYALDLYQRLFDARPEFS